METVAKRPLKSSVVAILLAQLLHLQSSTSIKMIRRLQESKDQLAVTSLSSSWHSSSLTFNHPQPSASSRPLTEVQSQRNRFSLPSRSAMAKIVALALTILVVMVVVGLVVGDDAVPSSTPSGRARVKTKNLASKKKKVTGNTVGRLRDEFSTPTPTEEVSEVVITPPENISEEQVTTRRTTERPLRPKKPSRAQQQKLERLSRESNGPIPEGCGECDLTACRNQAESSCHVGLVLDRCSCCMICGTAEGNRCFNSSIPNLSQSPDLGICGTGLDCILRKDLDQNEPLEALCECRDRRLVCGNDNQTYVSECKLREAAFHNKNLSMASWGPCVSAPWMPSSVENITIAELDDASLSCEVKGFPSPIIHWEFLPVGSGTAPKILPGDDSSVVVTVRGGPEQTMSTSWIQIIAVTSDRQGTYYCVATNPKGVARSEATVTISQYAQGSHDNYGES